MKNNKQIIITINESSITVNCGGNTPEVKLIMDQPKPEVVKTPEQMMDECDRLYDAHGFMKCKCGKYIHVISPNYNYQISCECSYPQEHMKPQLNLESLRMSWNSLRQIDITLGMIPEVKAKTYKTGDVKIEPVCLPCRCGKYPTIIGGGSIDNYALSMKCGCAVGKMPEIIAPTIDEVIYKWNERIECIR